MTTGGKISQNQRSNRRSANAHDPMAHVFKHAPNLAVPSLPKNHFKPTIPSSFQFPDLASGKLFPLNTHSPTKPV